MQRQDGSALFVQPGHQVHRSVDYPPRQVAAKRPDEHGADLDAVCRNHTERACVGEDHDQAEQDLRNSVHGLEDSNERSGCSCYHSDKSLAWDGRDFAVHLRHQMPAVLSRLWIVTPSRPPTLSPTPSARSRSRTRACAMMRSAIPRAASLPCSSCSMREPARSMCGDAERSQITIRISDAAGASRRLKTASRTASALT